MKTSVRRILYWSPRILCLLFAAFTSIFALDVFDGQHAFLQTMLALFMHLIPTFILLLVLAVAWRWEWIGGVVFTALGVLYTVGLWGRFHWSVYVIMSGTLILVGALFFVNWMLRSRFRPAY
ncbi:MAG TPA: hypothetical protein PKA41_09305 [Verrucomicrobiota bacterium]|nr:hypothetical protein [Verrucomicrobiota bacterium]